MSQDIFRKRKEKLRKKLSQNGLDGILITSLTNVRYVSGFSGSAASCLVTPDRSIFITDGRYIEQSKAQVVGFERHIGDGSHFKIAKDKNLITPGLKLAIEGDDLTVNKYKELKILFSKIQWEPCHNMVEEIAAVKDQVELEAIRTAVEITDRVYEEVLPMIKEGITEKFIANELLMRYRTYGDGEAYEPIVAAGPNGALPHAVPTDRAFEKGDFVVIDAAAKYAGYHSDMTRTPVVGEATDRHREIYDVVLKAQVAACKAAKSGMSCKSIDAITRDYITDKGFGENYIHGTGHGLGLEIHTIPRLNQKSKEILQENYVVTIEPGLYFSGWGGVRIEDDIIIGKNNSEILNKTTKELIVLK